MWKNKLSRTNTRNRKILILRILRTYENILKEFFHVHFNKPSFTWERTGERWLQWDIWKNGFSLTIWQWQIQVEIQNNRILFIVPGNKKWCSQLEHNLTVYSWAGQFLSTCHNLRSTRKQVTLVGNCLHKIVPDYFSGRIFLLND